MKGIMLLLALMLAPPAMAEDEAIRVAASEAIEAAGEARLVVLGEMHGTQEIPVLVAALAEHYSEQGPLLLALEMERTEHQALARYLASDGAAPAREALRRRPYWNIPDTSNDGRRSIDMLDLIERTRALRAAGRDVAIAPYDLAPLAYDTKADRERGMAGYLQSAYEALPRGRMLVLTGNLHALLQPRMLPGLGSSIEPMTYHLRDLRPFSIKVRAATGASWGCRVPHACGPQPYSDASRSGPTSAAPAHYHHQVVLPAFSLARMPGGDSRAGP